MLTKSGTGTLALTASNTYSGGTNVTAGTVALANGGALGTGLLTLDTGTTAQSSAALTVSNAINLAGNATWNTNGNDTTLSGLINGAALTKSGAGTLSLTNSNVYTGGTNVSAGTISLGNNNALGTGTLSLAAGTTAQSNTAALTVANAISLAGAATWNTNGNDTTLTGQINGANALTKSGAGTLTLNNSGNNYTGGTTITAGTVALGTAAALGTGTLTLQAATTAQSNATGMTVANAIDLAGNGTWDTNGNDTTLSGAITGAGSFTKNGAGNLTLTGANGYTGGTTVSAGTLTGNTTGLQGNITNNAALVFDQATDATFASALSGTGTLTKTGAGNLNLTGTTNYSGTTTINAGVLRINGTGFASAVTVNTGGTLGGTGTIGNNVTIAGGTWKPGNSIGTQNVTGNVSFGAGSVYQVELDATGASDRIVATGTATLSGGTVQVLAASGNYAITTTYTILTATGGVAGTFTGVTSDLAFLTPTLTYDANNVFLGLTRRNFSSITLTPNQEAVSKALDKAAANGQMDSVVNAISNLNANQARSAYSQMSGEANADMGSVNLVAGQQFIGMLGQQMQTARGSSGSAFNSGTRVNLASLGAPRFGDDDTGASAGSPARGPWNTWMSGVGVAGKVDGNGNASTLRYDGGGGALGIDKQVTPDLIAGIAAGYANTSLYTQGSANGNGTVDSYQGAFYGSYNPSAFYVQGLVGYAYNDNTMTRQISFPGINSIANGSTYSNQFLGAVEGGYEFPVDRVTSLTPFVGIQSTVANQASFTETGAGTLNLNVDAQTTTSVRSILGFQVDHDVNLGFANPIGLLARAGWAHEYANTARPITASFAGAPGAGFTVNGAQAPRDSAILAVGASARLTPSLMFLLRYDGDIAGRDFANAVTGRLSYTW